MWRATVVYDNHFSGWIAQLSYFQSHASTSYLCGEGWLLILIADPQLWFERGEGQPILKLGVLITGLGMGGAENHLLKLLPKLKHDVFVISLTNKDDIGREMVRNGIRVYYLGLTWINLPAVICRFRKLIRMEKPDVLDTYLIHANLFGRVFGRAFGAGKIICSIRSDYSHFPFLNYLDKATKGLVDLYVPNSKALVRYLHDKNGVPREKICVVPNMIDAEALWDRVDRDFSLKSELGLAEDTFLLLFVGRPHPAKNLPVLLRAIGKCGENVKLALSGDGQESASLKKLSAALGIGDRVFFLGIRTDVPNLLNSADAFVLPSYREGMSNALLEAMAMKKCCIVSDIPQNTDLVQDGVTGLVARTGDVEDLAGKIRQASTSNERAALGDRAHDFVRRHHTPEKVVGQYEAMYANPGNCSHLRHHATGEPKI